VKSSETHAFFTNRDASICICPIQLKKEFAVVQLLDLIHSERYRAGIRFNALVDEGIDANPKSMI
jgi:hypothetical protein